MMPHCQRCHESLCVHALSPQTGLVRACSRAGTEPCRTRNTHGQCVRCCALGGNHPRPTMLLRLCAFDSIARVRCACHAAQCPSAAHAQLLACVATPATSAFSLQFPAAHLRRTRCAGRAARPPARPAGAAGGPPRSRRMARAAAAAATPTPAATPAANPAATPATRPCPATRARCPRPRRRSAGCRRRRRPRRWGRGAAAAA